MPLLVKPLEEKDLEDARDIHISAFGTTSSVHPIMYPNGITDAVKASILKICQDSFHDSRTSCCKVIDTDNNNKMAAYIDWKTFLHNQPESEWNNTSPPTADSKEESSNSDINTTFMSLFFGGFDELKRTYVRGVARLHISLLITHASYHRRGCGKLLLDHCAAEADKLHLPIFLEASPIGAPLYLREGFVPIKGAEKDIDLSQYGREGVHRTVLMRRPAVSEKV